MKKINYLYIAITGLLLINGGCHREVPAEGDCDLKNSVKSVSDTKGIVWYDTQSEKYAVFSGIEGTYDSQDIGIPCNLPDNYKSDGFKILFSGNYYNCEEFSSLIGGQTYYYLEITGIKPVLEE